MMVGERKPICRTYLMCPPRFFRVEYEINPWMDTGVPVDADLAVKQWERLREILLELVGDVFKETLLLFRCDSVDLAKGESKQTIVVLVGDESLRNDGSEFDCLAGGSSSTNVDSVVANGTGSATAITVGDVPRGSFKLLPGAALAGIESRVFTKLASWERSAENPSA